MVTGLHGVNVFPNCPRVRKYYPHLIKIDP